MEQQIQNTKDLIKTLIVVSLISLFLYKLWSRRTLYRFAAKFPGCFTSSIIAISTLLMDHNALLKAIDIIYERSKSYTMCFWAGFHPTVLTSDPEFIEKVLLSPDLLNKAEIFYKPPHQALKGGIITSPVSIWSHNRKMINPSFHHKVLVSLMPIFHKGKNALLAKLDKMANDGEQYKLSDIMLRLSMGISMETTMGKTVNPGDQVDEELINALKFIMDKVVVHIVLACLNLGPLFFLHFKFQRTKTVLYKFVFKLLEEKLKIKNKQTQDRAEVIAENSMESMKKKPMIFIDQAIETFENQKFSFHDVIAESNSITVASSETSATTTLSVLVMLATHPDVQERLYEEIVNVFPDKNFEMEFEHFAQLPYLDMIINETLRLAPPIPVVGRQVVKDTVLSKDLVLPKDLQIIFSIYHLHRRKDIWGPNANNFNPDNFLPENIAGKHPYAYIPFSKGARSCIGWRYALFVVKVLLTGLVRNYRFTTSTKYEDIKFGFFITLKYINEPAFRIHRRQ